MHLTGGQFKGIKIDVPKSARPTLSKVRESIFNMLIQFDLEDKNFLDMFAGSGIMGLEAISRGYNVVQLEISPKTASVIKKNYAKIKVNPKIILADSMKYKTQEKYNVIYIDPPWNFNYDKIILKASELLANNGVIILEHDKQINNDIEKILKENNINLKIVKEKKYGRCLITILKNSNRA